MAAPNLADRDPFALTLHLAVAAFVVAGGIHYQSPMLAAIALDLEADAGAMGWIPTLSFGGMFVGIMLLVPLGDRFNKRPLILIKLWLLLLAQAVMAVAPSIGVLAVASLITGICSSVAQNFIEIVAEVARPNQRGRAVGTLLMGLFIGLLFARIVGGLLAAHVGWRASYVLSSAMLLALILSLLGRLPNTAPTTRDGYATLLWSVASLLRANITIRRAAAIQFLLGICYGGFWAVVAPMLWMLHRLGPMQAGLIGIPGAAGILVARPAGRWMDRAGAGPVVLTALIVMIAAWLCLGLAAWSVAFVVLGVILLDCGLRAAMVANQTLVNTVLPESRGRANTLFGVHVWAGNATGAFLASAALLNVGWLAVCALALSASGLALLLHLGGLRAEVARSQSG